MSEGKAFSKYILRYLMRCPDCAKAPAVFIQTDRGLIGVCRKHWRKLAYREDWWDDS